MNRQEAKEAARLIQRLDALADWVVMIEKDENQWWMLDDVKSSKDMTCNTCTVYSEDRDTALVMTSDELMVLVKALKLDTEKKLTALGVENK